VDGHEFVETALTAGAFGCVVERDIPGQYVVPDALAALQSLAREVSAQGVRVNAVAPGPISTDLVLGLSEEWRRNKAAELPLGRFGEPWEVAETVSFLASDGAALYVGQTLGPNSGDVML